nr:GGDEF domain-containing protein [Thiospirillum jenense]
MTEGILELALLAYASKGAIVSEARPRQRHLPPELFEAISDAIISKVVIERRIDESSLINIIYPVYNQRDEIYGVLLHATAQPSFETQRLTYGLLRIYSNYLALLEDSQRDKLTNVFNRETLDAEITKRIISFTQHTHQNHNSIRRRDDEGYYWLCLLDVDHFKNVNDTWGHLYGDEVLILLARLLEAIFRKEDPVFRYGGEEFVVIFRTFHLDDAQSVVERARKSIEKHSFPGVGQVTVSIGAVQIFDQDSATNVVDQADKALYYAKTHGRNCSHFYAELLAAGLIEKSQVQLYTSSVDFF